MYSRMTCNLTQRHLVTPRRQRVHLHKLICNLYHQQLQKNAFDEGYHQLSDQIFDLQKLIE